MQRQKKGKGKGDECVICFGPWTVFMHLSESGLCIEDGWSITYPQLGQFHPTNLFLSLYLWCKDLAWQKKRKRIWSKYIECFGPWTVFMRWSESGLCTRDGWLRADQFHPTNLFLSLNLWCNDLVPQKIGKVNEVGVLNVSATGLSLCAEQRVDFVQEMGD